MIFEVWNPEKIWHR